MRLAYRSKAMAKEIALLALRITGDKTKVIQISYGKFPSWKVFRIDPAGKEFEI